MWQRQRIFTVVFYGRRNFGCKATQSSRRKIIQTERFFPRWARFCKTVKNCAKTLSSITNQPLWPT